jgi:hypothetical protein
MTSEIQHTCSHCGGPVSTKGKAPKSGKRFCSNKGCRAAKARLRRQVFADDRAAPSVCSGCQMALPPRQWRAGDEHGRWCPKPRCKAKRRNLSLEFSAESDALRKSELLENAVLLLSEAVMSDNPDDHEHGRVICYDCGLTTALSGWPHRREDGGPCKGTLGKNPLRRPVSATHLDLAWPFRREYLTADHLKALAE